MKKIALLFLAACSSSFHGSDVGGGLDGGGGDAGGRDDAASSADAGISSGGAVGLVVNGTDSPSTVATMAPAANTYYVELNVTLSNGANATPLAGGYQAYSLATDASLVLIVSPAAAAIDTPCSPTTSVAKNGAYTCNLVFEVPDGQKPVTLTYDDKQGHTVTAPVPAMTLSSCMKFYTLGSTSSCQTCVNGACSAQATALQSKCTSDVNICVVNCQQTYSSPGEICDCEKACVAQEPSCRDGWDALFDCDVSTCGGSCQ